MSLGSNCGPTLLAMLVFGTGTPSMSQLCLMAAAHVQHGRAPCRRRGREVGDHLRGCWCGRRRAFQRFRCAIDQRLRGG